MQLPITQTRWVKLAAAAALVAFVAGCEDNTEDNTKVVDAVVAATDTIYGAIESDPDTWLTQNTVGLDVLGTAESPAGGSVEVSGWRLLVEEEAGTGYHAGAVEKLFLNFSSFGQDDVFLSGGVTFSRHSVDFGPRGGTAITDASRTTEYKGTVRTTGSVSGDFTLDIHGVASGTVEWTCGTVNDEGHGQGPCFE